MLTQYPKAGLVIGGDKNNLNISSLLIGIPGLRQLVTKPTYNAKVLYIILTNLHQMYAVPIIVPPVPADDPCGGAPSDHSTAIALPLSADNMNQHREYVTKVSRPLPDSGIREFGQWIGNKEWTEIENMSPTEQVTIFEKSVQEKVNVIFPKKNS